MKTNVTNTGFRYDQLNYGNCSVIVVQNACYRSVNSFTHLVLSGWNTQQSLMISSHSVISSDYWYMDFWWISCTDCYNIEMPVGLEATIDGTKMAPDITYMNTFQYPERNSRITNFKQPVIKSAVYRIPVFTHTRPKVERTQLADAPNLYCLTKQSVDSLTKNGSLKQSRLGNFDLDVYQPVAHLQHVSPSISRPQSRQQSFMKQVERLRSNSARRPARSPTPVPYEELSYKRQLVSSLNLSIQGF